MKRIALLALISLFSILLQVPANARTPVADCIELKFPKATTTSTVFQLTVEVYAICTEEQIGSGKGQKPLFSMEEEESLFNLSSCSGPTAQPRFGLSNGYIGTATCTLRVGSNTLPSPRTGATSTTIRMWFAWDFSSKTISVPHVAIPAGTNNGWGGSVSGGTGGTSSAPKVPVAPSCTSAPSKPNLTVEWNTTGPKFNYSPATTGEKTNTLYWGIALWNSQTSAWESWSNWTSATAASGSYQASVIEGKTKIAFAVYASNACGTSDQAREAEDRTGVALVAQSTDTISSIQNPSAKLRVGQQGSLTSFASSRLKLTLTAISNSPAICEITATSTVKFLSPGDCELLFSSVPDKINRAAESTKVIVKVFPSKIDQTIPDQNLKQTYFANNPDISLTLQSSAGLLITFDSANESVCRIRDEKISITGIGECLIFATQFGDENTNWAPNRDFSFSVLEVPKKSVITCVKGKLTKKVTAIKPKCPTGYKKR
jgi:hypothetical protein